MFGKLVSSYDYSHNVRLEKRNLDQFLANFMGFSSSFNSSNKLIYFKDIQLPFGRMPKPEGFLIHAFILSNPREASPKTIHSMVIGVSKIGRHSSSTSNQMVSNLGKILRRLFDENFADLKVLSLYEILAPRNLELTLLT
jgi:hypothetical protein